MDLPKSSILRALQTFNRLVPADSSHAESLSMMVWAAEFGVEPLELVDAIAAQTSALPRRLALAAVEYMPADRLFTFCKSNGMIEQWWKIVSTQECPPTDMIESALEDIQPTSGVWWEMVSRLPTCVRRPYLRNSPLLVDIFAEMDSLEEIARGHLRRIHAMERINEEQHSTIVSLSAELDDLIG